MAKKGKKNKKNNVQKPFNNIVEKSKDTSVGISDEDAKLLEIAREIAIDGELDRTELLMSLESDLIAEIDKKREELQLQLIEEREIKRREFKAELEEEYSELSNKNEELKKENSSLERAKILLEREKAKIEENQKKILDDAKEEAEKIIIRAKKDAENINEEFINEIKEREIKLEDKEDEFETREMELDAREKQLNFKEKRLKKQEEIYDRANPEAVDSLKRQLQVSNEQLEDVREEYAKVQLEFNKVKIAQIKTQGISATELQETNEKLLEKVEELENKCNRYSEFELMEMKRALDEENDILIKIRNLEIEINERNAEISRLKNGKLEYEQLKSQLDLLRTLNDHLRSELDNTKKMLESSVGEICPALTAIDIQQSDESGEEYQNYIKRLENKVDARSMSLSKIVEHVKIYAASREKPLFYSDKDLRAFIAGMASSHITILQGMSGTGKTSLPKIFSEAIMGEINVVPVESSWRDRNELLGYYNDFSKKFTAKEFTCDLYRAGCERYKNTIYLIVLDEMNLSRVEYYFADFLSVLEDKESNWKIKLVDTDMRQLPTEITTEVRKALENDESKRSKELLEIVERLYPETVLKEDEELKVSDSDKRSLITYLSNNKFKDNSNSRYLVGGPQGLLNGNTVRIPSNVWFVGTANRDESTFEITDKVYDRAQVLNFSKRAIGTKYESDVEPLYIPFDLLKKLFVKAQKDKSNRFIAEENNVLQEIEQVLINNFKISYGNRIQDQINLFVPVYVEAGKGNGISENELINEAIDYQITNKVLRRLEYIEMNRDANKEAGDKLRKIFEKYKLVNAKEFIDWKLRGEE